MRCPHCKNKVLQKAGDSTRLRTHGPVEFGADGVCHTKCHWCRRPIELPLELKPGVEVEAERFYVRGRS